MNQVFNRRTRQATAASLAALIFLLSPGLSGYQAFAVGLEGTVHPNVPVPAWRGGIGQAKVKKISAPASVRKAVPNIPKAPAAAPAARTRASADGVRQSLGRSAQKLQKPIEEAVNGKNPRATGEDIQKIIQGGSRSGSRGEAPAVKSAVRVSVQAGRAKAGLKKSSRRASAKKAPAAPRSVFIKERMADPSELYEQAYKEASEAAAGVKLDHVEGQASRLGAPLRATDKELAAFKETIRRQVRFGEVTGSWPLRGGRHIQFAFYVSGLPGASAVSAVYVTFSRGHGTAPGQFESRVSVASGVAVPSGLSPELIAPREFKKGAVESPESALDQAQKGLEGLGGRASFSLSWEKNPGTGDAGLWYRFYDEKGNQAAVSAAGTGEVRVLKRAGGDDDSGKPSSLWRRLVAGTGIFGAAIMKAGALFAAQSGVPDVSNSGSSVIPAAVELMRHAASWTATNILPGAGAMAVFAAGIYMANRSDAQVGAKVNKATKDRHMNPFGRQLLVDLVRWMAVGLTGLAAVKLMGLPSLTANLTGSAAPSIGTYAVDGAGLAMVSKWIALLVKDPQAGSTLFANLAAGFRQAIQPPRFQYHDVVQFKDGGETVEGRAEKFTLTKVEFSVWDKEKKKFVTKIYSTSQIEAISPITIVKKWSEGKRPKKAVPASAAKPDPEKIDIPGF